MFELIAANMDTVNDVLYYYGRLLASPGVSKSWKCESFASFIALAGIIASIAAGINDIVLLNPNSAWMGSIISDSETTCVNVTCGGYYCDFAQPKNPQCDKSPYHLEKGETLEICNPVDKCDWEVKVVTDSGYENRTFGLYIVENSTGDVKNFPQVENFMHQYVDLVKYVNSQFGITVVNWDLQARTKTTKMDVCPTTIPNSRCGAYTLFFDKTIFEFASKKRYSIELELILVMIYLKSFLFVHAVKHILAAYIGCRKYETKLRGNKNK